MYQSIYINAFLLTVLIYRIEIYLLHMLSSMDLWRILEDLWNYCLLLPNIANCCQLLPTIDNHCLLLPTIANYCQLLPSNANYCQLLPSIANYCHHTIANLRTLVDRDCCLGNKHPPFPRKIDSASFETPPLELNKIIFNLVWVWLKLENCAHMRDKIFYNPHTWNFL